MNQPLIAFLVSLVLIGPGATDLFAQTYPPDKEIREKDPPPRLDKPRRLDIGVIDGEQAVESDKGADRFSATAGENGLMPPKDRNGVQVFRDLQGRRTIEISADKLTGIKVVILMHYSDQNKNQLISRYPELADYITLFPKAIDGHAIAMDLTLKSVHEAKTLDQLKAKHPKAYQLFRKYYRQPGPANSVKAKR